MARTNIRNLDIGMLRTFDALMRERSVSRAATRLFLSQPAVSQSLRRLREAFDDPLFTRTPHGVTPTAKAQALAAQVGGILAELERLLQDAQEGFRPQTAQRVFRIAGGDYSFRILLPELARRLHRQAPGIHLHWLTLDFLDLDQQLAHGDVDLALVPRLAPQTDDYSESLYQDAYVLVVSHDHPLARVGPISVAQFCSLPHAILGSGTFRLEGLIDDALARLGHQRVRRLTVATTTQLLQLVEHGEFAAVVPQRIVALYRDTLHDAGMPLPIPPYTLQLCHHARSVDDGGVAWLRGHILEILAPADVRAQAAGRSTTPAGPYGDDAGAQPFQA
ncbi:MAG: LysR family transcriptional regulator [Pigmentiphaga sp.]